MMFKRIYGIFLGKIKNEKVLSQKEIACIEFEVKLIQRSLK